MMQKLFVSMFAAVVCFAGTTKAQTVMLDYYFNHEVHQDASGKPQRYHYLWEEHTNTGFSIWGDAFKKHGGALKSLETAPTLANLRGADIYIIVDPDNAKESAQPNYITANDNEQIAQWVKAGGVLVLMANDSINVELPHFNTLAAKFGLHFNNDMQNHVIDDKHFADGVATVAAQQIFKTTKKIFIKDACSIALTAPAYPALTSPAGAVIAAVTKYGKGIVFAVGDPWLYNEYVNGRLPAEYENDKAADDLAQWLLTQAKHNKR